MTDMKRTMQDENHIELLQAIARLDTRESVIETKIDELVRRVGVQNGRVADAEAAIKKLLSTDDINKGRSIGISTVWKIVVTILTIIIGILSYMAVMHP